MKNFSKLLGTSLFLGVLASGGVVAQEKQEINFGIISTESSQNLRQVWEPFLEDMSEITGYQVNAFFASDYAGIIQAMRFDKVDIAWLGNKSAMEAVDRAGGEVIYQTIDSNGDGGYWSLLIAHKDSPLNSVEDVLAQAKDLNFGNGDPNSTSGFLVPGYYVFAQNNVDPKQTRLKQLPRMIEAIETASADNILRAEHFLHLRCEVSHERTLDIFKDLVQAHPALRLVSVMDHTPGQRQFVKYEKYKEYYQGKYHLSESELEAFIVRQKANGAKYSDLFRQEIVAVCQDKGIAIASHDDANGLAYGIRADLNQHLHAGKTVLVNGSRAYWPQVVQRYPNAILVLVKVPVSLLRQRLMARGRESLPEIQLRLERSLAMEQTLERHAALQNTEFWVVDNSGSLAEAVAQFQALLSEIWV